MENVKEYYKVCYWNINIGDRKMIMKFEYRLIRISYIIMLEDY